MIELALLALLVVSTMLCAVAALFLKRGSASFSLHPKRWFKQHHMMVAGVFYFASTAAYIVLLRYMPLSVAYPLTGMTYLWVLALSIKYLGEQVDAWRWAGVCLIVVGMGLLFL